MYAPQFDMLLLLVAAYRRSVGLSLHMVDHNVDDALSSLKGFLFLKSSPSNGTNVL